MQLYPNTIQPQSISFIAKTTSDIAQEHSSKNRICFLSEKIRFSNHNYLKLRLFCFDYLMELHIGFQKKDLPSFLSLGVFIPRLLVMSCGSAFDCWSVGGVRFIWVQKRLWKKKFEHVAALYSSALARVSQGRKILCSCVTTLRVCSQSSFWAEEHLASWFYASPKNEGIFKDAKDQTYPQEVQLTGKRWFFLHMYQTGLANSRNSYFMS